MPPLNTGRNGGEPTSTERVSDVTTEPARKRREFRLPVMSRVIIQSQAACDAVDHQRAVGGRGRLHRVFVWPPFAISVRVRQDDADPPIADPAIAVDVSRFDRFTHCVFARLDGQ